MKKSFLIVILIVVFIVIIFLLNRNKLLPQPFATQEPTGSPIITPSPTPALIPTLTPEISQRTYEILISKTGISRQALTIKVGDTVKFINNDDVPHWPASGIHPIHLTCPGFDSLRSLERGESYSFTFNEAKECPFHDHLNAGNQNLKGKITVVGE